MSFEVFARRIERAQTALNRSIAMAAGAEFRAVGGGFAAYVGAGHMLNQALCMGFDGAVDESELDAMESLLAQGGAPIKIEVPSFAAPEFFAQLAQRRYRITEFQQVLVRPLTEADAKGDDDARVRLILPDEGELFSRLVSAGFMGQNELPNEGPAFLPKGHVEGTSRFIALVDGEPAGAGTMGIADGIATLAGTSTLPRFRGRGIQTALVRTRLRLARLSHCEYATTAALPGTSSFRNMRRLGFEVLYRSVAA